MVILRGFKIASDSCSRWCLVKDNATPTGAEIVSIPCRLLFPIDDSDCSDPNADCFLSKVGSS